MRTFGGRPLFWPVRWSLLAREVELELAGRSWERLGRGSRLRAQMFYFDTGAVKSFLAEAARGSY